jgi:hypothetical protein
VTFSDEFHTYLTIEAPRTSALVGTRVSPLKLVAQAVMPAITYQRISGLNPIASQAEEGPTQARIRINCWDVTYEGANALAGAVISDLKGDAGPGNGHTKAGDQEDDDPNTGLFRRRLEYLFWIDE